MAHHHCHSGFLHHFLLVSLKSSYVFESLPFATLLEINPTYVEYDIYVRLFITTYFHSEILDIYVHEQRTLKQWYNYTVEYYAPIKNLEHSLDTSMQ